MIQNAGKTTYVSHHEIGTSKMSESRCADATSVWPVRSVTVEKEDALALLATTDIEEL